MATMSLLAAAGRRAALRGRVGAGAGAGGFGRLCAPAASSNLLRSPSCRRRRDDPAVHPMMCVDSPVGMPVHLRGMSSSAVDFDADDDADGGGDAEEGEEEQLPRFSDVESLHPSSLHAVAGKMKLTNMTEIQAKTFEAASTGRDVLGRARTGTGKTLAFLLPAIESALKAGRVPGPHDYREYGGGDGPGGRGGIAILVLSPTRELAMQIHNQAQLLAASHANGMETNEGGGGRGGGGGRRRMVSQVMYGGSSRGIDLKKLEQNPPFVLVATPGRCIDHMENSRVDGVPFAEMIGAASVVVLDEADRCLDMGFRNDMEFILGARKRMQRNGAEGAGTAGERQTLLFSATLPKDLRSIMASHMRKDYLTVDCIHDVDPATHTNANIDQSYVTLPDASRNRWIQGLVDIVEDIAHVQNPADHKIVVFFPTTAACQLFSDLFRKEYRMKVMEIHSKKNQSNRTLVSDKFRKLRSGMLFTTDVSARGVDYPNVTHVIQYGSAENRETYIHRLGRTGRAGKMGRGIVVLGCESEARQFVHGELKGLEVREDERYQRLVDGEVVTPDDETAGGGVKGALFRKEINETRLEKIMEGIGTGSNPRLAKAAEAAYRSLIGYSVSKMGNLGMRNKVDVVEYVNSLALQMGFDEGKMPRLSPRVVQAVGLRGVPGINVGSGGGGGGGGRFNEDDGGRNFGRGGGRGGGGGGGGRGGRFGGGGGGRGKFQDGNDGGYGRGRGRYDGDDDGGYGRGGRGDGFDDSDNEWGGRGGGGRREYGRQRGGRQRQGGGGRSAFPQRWESESY